MHTVVSDALKKLRRTMFRLRLIALVESAVAVSLFPLVVQSAGSTVVKGLILLALGAYAWFKLRDVRSAAQQTRQLRLEESFVRQDLNVIQLNQCFGRESHLWAASLVLRGLQGVQRHPLPRLLEPEARIGRLRVHFQRAFLDLQHTGLHLEWLLLAFAGVLTVANAWPAAEAPLWPFLTIFGLLGALLVLEAVAFMQRRFARKGYEHLEQALGEWALDAKLYNVLFDRRKLYAHTLLYEARPWFSANRVE